MVFCSDVALFSGGQDFLADPADVATLVSDLPPERIVYQYEIPAYSHLGTSLALSDLWFNLTHGDSKISFGASTLRMCCTLKLVSSVVSSSSDTSRTRNCTVTHVRLPFPCSCSFGASVPMIC